MAGAAVLFAAIGLTAIGSAYFHLAPSSATLLWDRLPMTVIFMPVPALTIAERIGMRTGRALFLPLIALGISSVLYWRHTEIAGAGDVRFYPPIQFFPMPAVPLTIWLFPARYTRTADLVAVAGCCVKKARNRRAVRKMKVDPSEPSCRGRLQTAMSCFGQKPRW